MLCNRVSVSSHWTCLSPLSACLPPRVLGPGSYPSSHHLATSAWKKRRRKRNGMPARNHTGRNLVQARRAPSFKFMPDATHNVEVRTKVPSHRSCRAKKHALAVKGSHILSGTLTRKEDGVFLLRHVFPAHCPGQHCSPSLLSMYEPVPW